MIKETSILGLITIAIAAAAGGCGKGQSVKPNATAEVVHNVSITKVGRSSIADNYEASGTVNAKTTTQVSANIMGRINSVSVKEGDAVEKGQLLVEIDDRDAETRLEKAHAALIEAEASIVELNNSAAAASAAVKTAEAGKHLGDVSFVRYRELYDRRSVSGQEFDEARARADAATAELERAKANVQTIVSKKAQINARIAQARAEIANSKIHAGYARIVSPVAGVIVKKFVETGATASPGVPLLSIEDSSQYRLETAVAESYSKMVRLGDRVNVRIDALSNGDVAGIIAEILPTSDATSRSYTVKINLPPNPLLRTGQFGLARFSLAPKEVIAVPQTAVIQRGQLSGVYLVGTDGTVRFRIVTTGKAVDGMVEVLSGINEDDEIASSESGRLADGFRVR